MKIPITKAILDDAEKTAILKPLESGWVVQGPFVKEFENLFKQFIRVPYAEATSNCTTALHLGLCALNIGVGDKVVVPAFTYVASANAVEYTGAQVVFCDIDLNTFNMDLQQLSFLLEKDPTIKAIMPVHLFGLCANMPAIMSLAKQYHLKVIEDAACGFDAWIDNQHAGTFGDCGCFSFHPRKAITTGEGGMLVTSDEKLAHQVSQLKDHGAAKSDLERHKEKGGSLLPDFTMRGYNYRMTDLQGALGVAQLQKAAYIMEGRRKVAGWYSQALKALPFLVPPVTPAGFVHGYQSYVCLFMGDEDLENLSISKINRLNLQRNLWMEKLEQQGIATRQGTHSVPTLTYYKNRYQLKLEDYLQAYAADRLSVTLPLYATMTTTEFEYVIEHLYKAKQPCVESVV